LGSLRTAWLPGGRASSDQRKVSGLPSTSLERLPSRVIVAPSGIDWLAPGLATGGEFSVLTATVSGRPWTLPSLTVSAIR
jgi:hypothetical protein